MNKKIIFEDIKRINEIGQEYWSASELYTVLEYLKWDKFLNVIDKAKKTCVLSGIEPNDHFPRVEKLIDLPKRAKRDIGDIYLTRYACYLIVQNADSAKEVVALGQTYFAVQTRKQELQEEFEQRRGKDEKSLFLRKEMTEHRLLKNWAEQCPKICQ
ncbi:MAG: BRO family protein [Bacteroidales bacterium]|nr:BRO family protein [Bacteroidales bacterium]MDD4217540.1 BRO family protein [Bacteroidales bacterium]MDY0142096.1 BRO family protein [Bacteroidales bacterium]